jgi:hypothetical protein
MLEMQPYMWSYAVGPSGIEDRKAFAFKVTRVPSGEYDVRIAEMGRGRWQILVTVNGKSEGWRGEYSSPADAFEAVQSSITFTKEELDESRLAELVQEHPEGITWSEVMRLCEWTNGNSVRATIQRLDDKGLVRVEKSEGHPAEQFRESVKVFPVT